MQPPFEILFYSEDDLSPYDPPSRNPRSSLFSESGLQQLTKLVDKCRLGPQKISLSGLEQEVLDVLKDAGVLDALILEQLVGRVFNAGADLLLALFAATWWRFERAHEISVMRLQSSGH